MRAESNGEAFACYVAAPKAYGELAFGYDVLIACLFVLGGLLGFFVPVPRRFTHVLLLISAVAIAAVLVFVAVPTAGLTSTQKKSLALSVFFNEPRERGGRLSNHAWA